MPRWPEAEVEEVCCQAIPLSTAVQLAEVWCVVDRAWPRALRLLMWPGRCLCPQFRRCWPPVGGAAELEGELYHSSHTPTRLRVPSLCCTVCGRPPFAEVVFELRLFATLLVWLWPAVFLQTASGPLPRLFPDHAQRSRPQCGHLLSRAGPGFSEPPPAKWPLL